MLSRYRITEIGQWFQEQASVAYRVLKSEAEELELSLKDWPERPSDLSAKLKKSSLLLDRLGTSFQTEH